MSEWISVKERLPDDNHDTLLVCLLAKHEDAPSGEVVVDTDAFYTSDGEFRFWSGSNVYEVTHWMPLPEPPKEYSNA